MTKITILTSPGCHTCETTKDILNDLEPEYNLEIEEIDITSDQGQKLAKTHYITAAPGILINGELFSSGPVTEQQLRNELDTL
ncbi:MAG TPA: glutaredoxin family protein [Candidatus Dependentiae bacterium]|nr:glutaredoxin family protein [Candidatus Dependentiae bacterium]HRQ62889.1 glutaredoxin family protein [Candidatus Dependentiae bacterium]